MKPTGRPVAYLVLFLVSWIIFRIVTLWPTNQIKGAPLTALQRELDVPNAVLNSEDVSFKRPTSHNVKLTGARWTLIRTNPFKLSPVGISKSAKMPPGERISPIAFSKTPKPASVQDGHIDQFLDVDAGASVLTQTPMNGSSSDRDWQFSAWSVYRAGSTFNDLASSGTLGGSQAGLRALRSINRMGRSLDITVTARVSSPLASKVGKEGAVGVGLRHKGRIMGEIVVERRIPLDDEGRGAFSAFAVGGTTDLPVRRNLSLDAYLQAGIVGMKSRDKFVDGAVSINHQIHQSHKIRSLAGLGLWGGAQTGTSRLDIGPIGTLALNTSHSALRVSVSWRFRIAGRAEPGSGPSITLGADF